MMKVCKPYILRIIIPCLFFASIIAIIPLEPQTNSASSKVTEYRFHVLGDFGDLRQNQILSRYPFELVLEAMNLKARKNPISKIITVGDNFYADSFEELIYVSSKVLSITSEFPELSLAEWTLSYGNHEFYFSLNLEEFANKRFLNFKSNPGVWSEVVEVSDLKIVFFYLPPQISCHGDLSNRVTLKQCKMMKVEGNYSEYLKQAEDEFEKYSKDNFDWRILVMHYPIFSMSVHGMDNENLKFHLLPLVEKFEIDLILTGHNHNMQYFTYQKGKKYEKQKFKKICLKEAKIKCGEVIMNCINNQVRCPEFNTTCEKRVSLNENLEIKTGGKNSLKFFKGKIIHQVVQGAGGSSLDPFCLNGKSPMASNLFGKAEYGFTEITVEKEMIVIRFFGIKDEKPLFQSRISSKHFYFP